MNVDKTHKYFQCLKYCLLDINLEKNDGNTYLDAQTPVPS